MKQRSLTERYAFVSFKLIRVVCFRVISFHLPFSFFCLLRTEPDRTSRQTYRVSGKVCRLCVCAPVHLKINQCARCALVFYRQLAG